MPKFVSMTRKNNNKKKNNTKKNNNKKANLKKKHNNEINALKQKYYTTLKNKNHKALMNAFKKYESNMNTA